MSLPKVKQDLTDATLALVPEPAGGVWIKEARKAARERLAKLGMPVRRDEYWKFTDPTAWTSAEPRFATTTARSDVFDAANALTLSFVDGVFDAAASDALALEGVEISLLSEAATADLHWAKSVYGVLEARANEATRRDGAALFKPVPRPLAALNTALAGEGVLIHVTGTPSRPIRLSYRSTGGQSVLHHAIKVETGANLTLLEEGYAGARFDTMIEASVADGGTLHHLRVQGRETDVEAATHFYAELGTESVVKSFSLTVDGIATRNEAVMELHGVDAVAHIAGTCLGDGATGKFHHDDTVYVTHDGLNGESRQVFKKVLRNGATGVFQGKILVQPAAQKTDGYQISQSLLLDDDSQFLAKPELEIYADDVACSHGSTTGAIDEGALFYLRSRGVPRKEAEDLLTLSFLAEALEEIEDDTLSEMVLERITDWLRG
ncbi:MAG: SufD family Fe-S cluster assembly protein [Pseudomonadota bacterium]